MDFPSFPAPYTCPVYRAKSRHAFVISCSSTTTQQMYCSFELHLINCIKCQSDTDITDVNIRKVGRHNLCSKFWYCDAVIFAFLRYFQDLCNIWESQKGFLLFTLCRMASEMFLYWGSGSPPCWRAMLVLEEKGLSGYPNKLLSFEKKEHKSEEVLKWNPRGQVDCYYCY